MNYFPKYTFEVQSFTVGREVDLDVLCCCCLCQGAAEGPVVLLRAGRDWRAEQRARPHHHAGARLPAGPRHRPLPGAQERGTTGWERQSSHTFGGGGGGCIHGATIFFFASARSASKSWPCAWGSCLSSGSCRRIRTGPTSSSTPKLTRSVRCSIPMPSLRPLLPLLHRRPFHVSRWRCWILAPRGNSIRVSLTTTSRWEAVEMCHSLERHPKLLFLQETLFYYPIKPH